MGSTRTANKWECGALLCLLLVAAPGCGADTESAAVEQVIVAQQMSEATRVKSYERVSQLRQDSSLIVVVEATGEFAWNSYYGDETSPFAITQATVLRSLTDGTRSGDLVNVSVEAAIEDGRVIGSKLEGGKEYLLFLTPQGPKAPDVYTVVGYLAGLYERSGFDAEGESRYVRLDPESPDLPLYLTPSEAANAS